MKFFSWTLIITSVILIGCKTLDKTNNSNLDYKNKTDKER